MLGLQSKKYAAEALAIARRENSWKLEFEALIGEHPQNEEIAPVYAVEMAKKMGLVDPEVINTMVLHPANLQLSNCILT